MLISEKLSNYEEKTNILLIILCFYGGFVFAHQQDPFYFYKGEQITLPINTQHFLVYADLTKISVDFFAKEYLVTEWIEDGRNGIIEAQVSIPNGNYDSVVNVLKAKEYVIDIEPVIGNNVLYNTSRLFYVKLHTPQDYSLLSSMASRTGAEIRGEVSFCENWYELSVNKNSTGNSIETANQFWESQYFEDIDPGFIFHFEPTSSTACVSDSRFDEQWGMQAVKACSAWKITKGDTNVRIAVIDMGIDVHHQEFDSTHVVFSYDIETNAPQAESYFTEDWPRDNNPNDSATRHYHGMHVGGIIFANHNRYEVAGCCPNSSLVNISTKFIDDDNNASKMANSINLAVLHGSKVINNSWGDAGGHIYSLHSPLIEKAIDNAIDQNRVVVFSVGNEGDSINYPARYRPDILTVGAVDSNLIVASFSNIGPELDVVAPGVSILSTYNPNTYHSTKGTSMSAPHVSGVMGLLFSINPNLTTREARDIVELTAQKIGTEPSVNDSIHNNGLWDYFVGYGLLDAHRAVLKAAFHKVYGDTALTLCDTNRHTYTVRAPHNANIDSVSFFWTCSDNLQMVAGQNTDSVWVKFVNSGVGQLQCHIIHDGDTVTSMMEIPIVSDWPVLDNQIITNGITHPDTLVLSREIVVDTLSGVYWQDKTVLCTPDCRIIVPVGGYFMINHTTLTSACPGEMWQGVEVMGDSTKQQILHNQGHFFMENGSIIENAFTGIRNCLATDNNYATTGGIIHATSSIFRNNRRAVEINPYTYSTTYGEVFNYASSFIKSTFTVNDQNLFTANDTVFTEHVKLWDVKGVTFEGCHFIDSMSVHAVGSRGVYAEDAGVLLDTRCDAPYLGDCECPEEYATYSSFTGFTTAVEVSTTGNPYPVTLNQVRFSNNVTGVKINGNNFATVTRCDFDLQANQYISFDRSGLCLNSCTGYLVEANSFHGAIGQGSGITQGIRVSNSGTASNELYRNEYQGLSYGVYAVGNNGSSKRGLQIKCSVFNHNDIDIFVSANSTIGSSQGTLQTSAGNIFANTQAYNVNNSGLQSINYFYTGSVLSPFCPNLHTGLVSLLTSNAANPCTSTLCDNNGGARRSLAGFQSDMNTYNAALADEETGGNASLSEMAQSLSATYYVAVREMMSDTVLDFNELEQWHTAAQPIADPYSLTETRFMEGYAEIFAENAETDAEMANYAEFHALKLALRGDNADNDNNDNTDNNNSQNSPKINWYALTPAQIAQLQTIAERNTGRASVMAKGVLCFFHGICYEDEWDNAGVFDTPQPGDDTTGTRAKHTAMDTDNDAALSVYPNPTDDVLFIEMRGGAGIANVGLYDLQGRAVGTRFIASATGASATVNMRDIPAGVYVLRVKDTDGKEYHQKIVRK